MHAELLQNLQHHHDFVTINKKGERRTRQVLVLTFLMMALEIAAGIVFGSMALLADGWHMATHVAAFMIALFAYRYSRIHAHDQTFAFSPGKVGVLGGFASSVALGVVALMMLLESGERLLKPTEIHFDEAIMVACLGLFINVICALLLREHDHHHHHEHDHKHHHDHNLKAAYAHVVADALTSILAIIALTTGKYYGWTILDPIMGIVGSLVIMRWSYVLMRDTSPMLVDESIAVHYKTIISEQIENDADNRIADLHVWRVGPGHFAVILSLVSHTPKAPSYYKELLNNIHAFEGANKLSHITVEVNQCQDIECLSGENQSKLAN